MKIIEIATLPNGAHRNQTWDASVPPNGWAIIPDNIEIPQTFPFVSITVAGNIVTSMSAGASPEPQPEQPTDPQPTLGDRVSALEEALDMSLSGVTE